MDLVSNRVDERIKHFVAVNNLQIGDEDGEFLGKSADSNGFVWFGFESRGKMGTMEGIVGILHRRRGNYTSREQEIAIASLGRPRSTRHLQRSGRPRTDYKVCIRKLDAHFRANDNVPYERHMFCHMAPLSGESADKFLVRLKNRQDILILARL